ncbi:MAG: glycosyltransferase family 39 protein [Alphaproteobacteria bacterium]
MKFPALNDADWSYRALFAALIVAGTAARHIEIGYSLDGDEIFSVSLAIQDFGAVIQGSLQDKPHPPLYNVLLHAWTALFGHGEIPVRALSILFSVGFLLLAERILARFVTPPYRLTAIALLAVSPFFLYYGQQARPYALIALLSAANLLAFLRLVEEPRAARIAIWAASCTALVYSQYIAVLPIAIEIAFAAFLLKRDRILVAGAGIAATVLIAPWVISAMGAALSAGADPLGQITWMGKPSLIELAWFYVSLFGEAFPSRGLFLLLLIPAAAYVWRAWKANRLPALHALLIALAIGLPLITYVLSIAGPKPVFAPRQLEIAGFAFIALIAMGLERLPSYAGAAVGAALIGWCIASIPEAYPHNVKPPWREVAREVAEKHTGAPLIVEEREFRRSVGYYAPATEIALWSEFPEAARIRRFTFLCRPFKCDALKALEPRAAMVARWHWNTSRGDTDYNQLKLYEVSPLGAGTTPATP